jgi:hypothetical protein
MGGGDGGGGVGGGSTSRGGSRNSSRSPVGGGDKRASSSASRTPEDEEGDASTIEEIPVRILLQICDEIFELRGNKLVRRAAQKVVFSVIRRLVGGNINQQVEEAINTALSTHNVANIFKAFKESWWPDDVLVANAADREEESKQRTAIEAKAKLLGLLPSELRVIVKQTMAKKGVLQVFEMLQYPTLNKKLMLSLLEALLIRLFPANGLADILAKTHKKAAASYNSGR